MLIDICFIFFAYLLGSLSFSIIICKFTDLPDPRSMGSKNAGATNVLRFASKKIAIMVLLGDVIKGVIAVKIATTFLTNDIAIGCVAFAVVFGHIFPIFFKFQGGKGIATYFGVLIVLSPIFSLWTLLTWMLLAYLFKYSSLASILSTIVTAVLFFLYVPTHFVAISALCLLLCIKHKDNIARLLKGQESKIGSKSK